MQTSVRPPSAAAKLKEQFNENYIIQWVIFPSINAMVNGFCYEDSRKQKSKFDEC